MVTLYNQDITNLVYISYQPWFKPGLGNSIPIQPLTSVTVSAKRAIYIASTVGGVASLLVLPEGSQANPSPAQIAAQINALGLAKETTQLAGNTAIGAISGQAWSTSGIATQTTLASQTTGATIATDISVAGTPLLTGPDQLANVTGTSVASGGTTTLGPYAFTKIGYEILVNLHTAAGTATYARVQMLWTDPSTGDTVDIQQWWLIPGSDATTNLHKIAGYGPSQNAQLSINLSAFNNTVIFDKVLLHQNSRIYTRHDWRTVAVNTLGGGLGVVSHDIQSMLLLTSPHPGVAAAAHSTDYAPLFAGKIQIWGHSSSNTSDATMTIQPIADQTSGASANVFQAKTDGTGNINMPVYIGRMQLQVVFTNNNAAAQTLQVVFTMADI